MDSINNLQAQLRTVEENILKDLSSDRLEGLNSKQLIIVSNIVNQAIRLRISQLFSIPVEEITERVLEKEGVPRLIAEVTTALEAKLKDIPPPKLGDPANPEVAKLKKEKKGKGKNIMIRSFQDLDIPSLIAIAQEFGWEYNDSQTENVVLNAARYLKTRVKSLVDYPDGIQIQERSIIGTLDDPDIKEDIKRHNSGVRRRGFRSLRVR